MSLYAKRLDPRAILPTVAHPEEDLGYDLYALEDSILRFGIVTKVRTGIAVEAVDAIGSPVGLLIKDRSSMAAKGVLTCGGVIDSGYRGEIVVLMNTTKFADLSTSIYHVDGDDSHCGYQIKSGDRIAQMIPTPILTGKITEVSNFVETSRGDKGFGSSDIPESYPDGYKE